MNYKVVEIGDDIMQIYGEVNGIAFRHYHQGVFAYHLDFKFFSGSKLIHVITSEKDNTMKKLVSITKRIDKIIKEES